MSNAIFPTLPGLAWSVFKTPQWSTRVQRSTGGNELRASYFSQPIWKWRLTYEFLRESAGLSELKQLVSFYNARQGMYDSFLYSDPSDSSVTNHLFGLGDGTRTIFQLQRTSGPNPLPRTNQFLWSEDFGNSPWSQSNVTVTPDAAIASDGTLTADKLAATTTAVTLLVQQAPATATTVYYSVEVKKGSGPTDANGFGLYNVSTAANLVFFSFNYDTGAVTYTSGTTGVTVQQLPDSWWRLTVAVSTGITAGNTIQAYVCFGSGAYTAGTFAYAARAMFSPGPGAYIRTTSAAVTVGAALWPATADAFEPVYNVNGTPLRYTNGVIKTPGTDYTLSNGLVTFLTGAPVNGSYVTWTGNYYWRARFDLDSIDFEQFMYQLWKAHTVSFVSVKGS